MALIGLVATSLTGFAAPANASVVDCINFGYPSVTSTSTSITVNVMVSARCPNSGFGLTGGHGVYSIVEESFASSCTGPYEYNAYTFGTISCRISLGGSLGSSRVGATSSTIKFWSAWDFSTKFITFSHIAIPSKTSTGGGSTGGTLGGGGVVAPAVPTCTGPPNTPVLTIERNTTGPKFNFTLAPTGQKATAMYWSYSLWNSNTKSWEAWSNWQSTVSSTGSYQATVVEGKSSIAFAVYASNACGSSEQAREAEDRKGISLAAQIQDQISRNTKAKPDLYAGQDADLYLIATSKLNLELSAKSLTPNICTVEMTQILLNSPGVCRLSVSSITYGDELGAIPTELDFEIIKLSEQLIPDLNLKASYLLSVKSVELALKTNASLDVQFKSLTPRVCEISGTLLFFNNTGSCLLEGSQDGDEKTSAAPVRNFEIWIDSDPLKTLTCVKGKLSKKVTGTNPKCPSGYKVKK